MNIVGSASTSVTRFVLPLQLNVGPWFWITGGVLVLLALLAILYYARKPRFKPQALMTANEREFYKRLLVAFPHCQVWPQVPVLALLRPDEKEDSRAFWRGFRMISNARVDWVIVQDLEVVAVVELDDRTHDARKDAKRDKILTSCGYRVVRFNSKRRPTHDQIRQAVAAAG